MMISIITIKYSNNNNKIIKAIVIIRIRIRIYKMKNVSQNN